MIVIANFMKEEARRGEKITLGRVSKNVRNEERLHIRQESIVDSLITTHQ